MDANEIARDILKRLIGVAASKAPGGSGVVINAIVNDLIFPEFLDKWLFPKAREDEFDKFKERIDLMIDKTLEVRIGEATFNRVKSRLTGLANAFTAYANAGDLSDRKAKAGQLLTMADATMAEVEAVPDRYLYLLTDVIQIIAVLNIAILVDQVKMYPDHYEHQLALNKAAIGYSNLAGRIRDRFLWYRLGQIAEGRGVVIEQEIDHRLWKGNTPQKLIKFYADDALFGWPDLDGFNSDFLYIFNLEPVWMPTQGYSKEYFEAKKKAQAAVETYAAKEKQKLYDWWGEHLTGATEDFMQFVDWPGEKGERKPKDRMVVRAYPVQTVPAVSTKLGVLERIDLFLGQQMDQFSVSGPRYVQTYRLPGVIHYGEQENMFHRADTYDTSVAAIYFTLRDDLQRACDLVDGLCTALEHDPVGGGRIVAATKATAIIDRENSYATSLFHPDGGTRDIGNMCWAGIALTRLYARVQCPRYLYNAMLIGQWIIDNCSVDDGWQGFSGGEDSWGNKRLWRSVEHNVDAYALFLNLHALTQDAGWLDAAHRAKNLVIACRLPDGYYVTGTGEDQSLNAGVVPTDTQSWTALAGIDPEANERSLRYMTRACGTKTGDYPGFRFALGGREIQNEVTAGAAMALHLHGGALAAEASAYYDSLARQQNNAPNTDGLGLVATPGREADTGQGLGWKY
ncbi:MAG: hypothetical protein P8Z31_07335, partial [Gammaproteobacteria bacterium]